MEDREIIERFWRRDTDAIAAARDKYGSYCFSVARNILESPEDSEECVNDTWLGAWRSMPPHRPDVLRMFLAKLTRNAAFGRVRSLAARKRGGGELPAVLEELSECLADETDVEGEVLARELEDGVRRFIRGLPGRERDLFLRRYFFAEPIRAIAQRYGLSENNTMVILSRTRKKLRAYLVKEGFLDE